MQKVVKDSQSRCVICGCILGKYYIGSDNICECCKDNLVESNPCTAYLRGEDIVD